MNKIVLVGRLGKMPVFKTIKSNFSVAELSLATNRYSKGKKEYVTDWHKVTVYNPGDYLKKYHKGDKISVEGYIKYPRDKQNRVYPTVIAEKIGKV